MTKLTNTFPKINIAEEFFNEIQDRMGGNLSYPHLAKQDKESFILALRVILELTSYVVETADTNSNTEQEKV